MPVKFKNIGIATLTISLCLVACSPSASVVATELPTLISSNSPIPSTITPVPLDMAPTPTISRDAPVLKYNSWEIIHDLTYSPNGQLLAVSAGEHVYLYDAATLVEQFDLPIGAWANRLAFHPSLPLIVLAVRDGTIQFWDTTTGDLRCQFIAHKKGANSLAINPDGSMLVSTGSEIISRLWNISSLASGGCDIIENGQLIGGSFSSPDVAFDIDGKRFALVDRTNVRLRNSSDLKLIASLPGDLPIFDIAFSPDDRWLAAAEYHDTITLWDLTQPASMRPKILQPLNPDSKLFTWRVAFSPDSQLLAAGASDGTLTLWDLSTLQPLTTHHLPRAVSALSFSPDGKYLAACGLDAQIRLFQVP